MVQTYTLSEFSDDEFDIPRKEGRQEEFVSFFEPKDIAHETEEALAEEGEEEGEGGEEEEEAAPEPVEETVDVEAETRRIFEEAFVQGEKAGYEMGLQRVEPLAKRLTNHITDLEAYKDELLARSRAMAVELALVFAEAVVLRSCEDNREIVDEMVGKALGICETKSNIVIRVRPDDVQYISSGGSEFVRVVPDESIRTPGFVIETNFGDIDGRMSTQIEELKKRILE